MRRSVLCFVYAVVVVATAVIVSTFFALADTASKRGQPTMEDLGAFILDHTIAEEETPVSGLEAFMKELPARVAPKLVLSVPRLPVRNAVWISDGNFGTLSASWKRGVVQVASDHRCKRHIRAFTQTGTIISPLLKEAQAIVESNCDGTAKGLAGEVGIYQVMANTCKEMGITGDYTDAVINARCAEKYREAYCQTVQGTCPTNRMLLAHNWGLSGARRAKHPESAEYVRKIDYAVRVLAK